MTQSVSARVARKLCDVILEDRAQRQAADRAASKPFTKFNCEWLCMLVAECATFARIKPADLDDEQGRDVLHAMYLTVAAKKMPEIAKCTPAWRRIVTSARRFLGQHFEHEKAREDARVGARYRHRSRALRTSS